jgi:pimeloyl-ACP methyl ester carboxylesterase
LSIASIPPRPAADRAEAEARFAALCARDDELVASWGQSKWFEQPQRVPLAVVLLHGFTSSPAQFVTLGEQLMARGHSVVIPRLPGHGDADRTDTRLKKARAEDWLAIAGEAVDIARGLGERVAVTGISLSGAIAVWLAWRRRDLARAVGLSPMIGVKGWAPLVDALAARALAALPDKDLKWDPVGDGRQITQHSYPRFPTHGLAQCLRIGWDLYAGARNEAPPRGTAAFLLNANDPAVSNEMTNEIARRWNVLEAEVECATLNDLPHIHDIADPENPYQRVGEVYPKLIDMLEVNPI